ncbi:hypothetical protein ACFJIW_16165 [Tahibacter sp. UC22_41]|uniref:hypothetical protein n=1 Tax=Tahibacter sp. UC22_41 TaxID=3350178 RepID=UPI0036D95B42
MRSRHVVSFILVQLLGAAAAPAQVYQSGYDLGPDYGAMLQRQLQQSAALSQQMQTAEQQLVQQVMQNPDCLARYQQHRAMGGQLSYPQFAYQYAATAGFSNDGIARFRAAEQRNQQAEQHSRQGYRQAQDQRAQAQQAYADGYTANQAEAGRVLQGNSSWVDPTTGQTQSLAYADQNVSVDPATGRTYYRDDSGQYYVRGDDGLWYAMTPGR